MSMSNTDPALVAAPRAESPSLRELAVDRALGSVSRAYTDHVDRLIAAGLEVMQRCGTTRQPTVAEIIAEAGSSNVSFYRHFASKEQLVAAIVEAGTTRLGEHLKEQMAKEIDAEARVRRWIEGTLAQARGNVAKSTRAVLWNGDQLTDRSRRVGNGGGILAELLFEPLRDLGVVDPVRSAILINHAVVGRTLDFLWADVAPTDEEVASVVHFCMTAVMPCP
jgi:AcrR family transcriptional regulator